MKTTKLKAALIVMVVMGIGFSFTAINNFDYTSIKGS